MATLPQPKHGLTSAFHVLPHEDDAEFDTLLGDYRKEFAPTGQHQNYLVNQMAQSRWTLARMQRLEACLFEQMMTTDPGASPTSPDQQIVANMLKRSADPIAALQRYAANSERSYHRAHREFQTAVKESRKQEAAEMDELLENMCGPPRLTYPILPPSLRAAAANAPVPATGLPLRV